MVWKTTIVRKVWESCYFLFKNSGNDFSKKRKEGTHQGFDEWVHVPVKFFNVVGYPIKCEWGLNRGLGETDGTGIICNCANDSRYIQ